MNQNFNKVTKIKIRGREYPILAEFCSVRNLEKLGKSIGYLVENLRTIPEEELLKLMEEGKDDMVHDLEVGALFAYGFYSDHIKLLALPTFGFEIKENGQVERFEY